MKRKVFTVFSLILLVVAGLLLMVAHSRLAGWSLWIVGLTSLLATDRSFARHLLLVYGSVALLGLIPINTDISAGHMLIMGSALLGTVLIPYLVTRYIYKESVITYPLLNGRWQWWHFAYIGLTALLAYLILPIWMQGTGDYHNWSVETDMLSLLILFIGTNALGIWDELFFVLTCFVLLRQHIPFVWANLVQASLWTIFLYELGFRSWMPLLLFPFAVLQGIVFKRTHSLLYLLAIHLTLDLVLYLALINAHHPHLVDIFVTG